MKQEAALTAEQAKRDGELAETESPNRDNKDAGQALVVVNPVTTERSARSRLADATFLAHMFATKFRAPQTCEKRRAAPDDANASYRKADQPAVRTGRIVSRKI